MQIRPQPLPDRVQYFLDAASEYGDMLGAAASWLSLYGDRQWITDIVENSETSGGWQQRHAIALHLQDEAFRDALAAEEPWRSAFLSAAALSARRIIAECAEFYSSWFYEDSIWGGCALPFKRGCRYLANWLPTPKTARRLRSRAALQRYIEASVPETADARKLTVAPLLRQPIVYVGPGTSLLSTEWDKAVEQWRIASSAASRLSEAHTREYARRSARPAIPAGTRKPVVRAARIAGNVIGDQAVRDFVAGRQVAIPGDGIVFKVARGGSIAAVGHGALSISLCDAATGSRLAGLCLFFDKTPALDQIAAIGLHVAAGEQDELLQAGNLYGCEAAALEHPLLKGRAKLPSRDHRQDNPQDMMRRAAAAYALEMHPVAQDIVADIVVGRQKRALLRCGTTVQDMVRAG